MALLKSNEHLFLCRLVEFGSDLFGRSVYLGYPGHLWVHGIDYGEREQRVKQILAGDGDINIINQIEVPISYLIVPNSTSLQFTNQGLTEVYTNSKFTILKTD